LTEAEGMYIELLETPQKMSKSVSRFNLGTESFDTQKYLQCL